MRVLVAAVCLTLFPTESSGASADRFADFLAEKRADTGFSGSVLVARGDTVIFAGGVGVADPTWNIPADANTRYVVASITKSMTAALVLALAEQQRIDLDATLAAVLPDYPADYAERVTVGHLLGHRSGIANFNALQGWFEGVYLRHMSRDDFLAELARLPLIAEPGNAYHYSNTNYLLLAETVEAATGKPFADALHEHLLDPLEMADTGVIERLTDIVPRLAINYRVNESQKLQKGGMVNLAHFVGSASNYATVHDIFRFVRGLQGNSVLGAESRDMLFDPTSPIGWNVADVVPAPGASASRVVSYNGELEGYNSMVTYIVDSDVCIVVLNNNDAGYDGVLGLTRELLSLLITE